MKHRNSTRALLSVIFGITLIVSADAFAFDGVRKGIVMGAGLGFSPWVRVQSADNWVGTTESGPGVNFFMGYAWNDRNMIVYEATGTYYTSTYFNKTDIFEGLSGVRWYYYMGRRDRPFFFSLGLGAFRFSSAYDELDSNGFGYSVGGGWEFMKQVQIGLFYSGGSSDATFATLNHNVLSVLVTVVAY